MVDEANHHQWTVIEALVVVVEVEVEAEVAVAVVFQDVLIIVVSTPCVFLLLFLCWCKS